ncbi:MAG TPA: carboxypeptidase regulatory-like domain-containing protein, partial [Gemmatimonadaceae bacterium]
MARTPILGRIVVAVALLALPAAARAQDPDIIRGRITGQDSLPIENVAVTVSTIAGDLTKTARTDKNGVFTVTFTDPQGDYWVSLQALGYAARRFEIKRLADEDVLVADARLSHAVTTLQAMRVQGSRPRASRSDGMNDITGGERSLNMSGADISAMGDLAALAGMLPGATFIPSVSGAPSGFSVFGLDPGENSFLLNGMSLGSGALPRDANLSASVSGSPYDASRGGFSGAQVNARMSSGTNFIVRTMSATAITPQMQWADRTAQSLALTSTKGSLGGRFAGPIKMNRLFYNVSYQFDHTSRDLRTLQNADDEGLRAVGISRDSVTNLIAAMDTIHMPFSVRAFPHDNLGQTGSLAGVIDYSPPTATSQSFRFTFAGNGGRSLPANFSLLDAPSHSGQQSNWTGSAQVQHSTYVKSVIFASTSLGLSRSANESSPYLDLPSATIRINSNFGDGTSGVQTVRAGGNPSLGTSQSNADLQFRNSLSWVSMDSKHRLSFTTDARQSMSQTDQSSNRLGSFSFNSLEDFEANQPASFTRVLTPRFQRRGQTTGGMALQDSWRVNQDFQMTLGVRADAGRFGSRPDRNPLIEQTFGVRNDVVPNPLSLSPRVSFSKTLGEAPQISFVEGAVRGPRARISGGIGVYQSAPSASLLTRVANNTGLPSAVQQLTCVGAATPIPDWQLYMTNPDSVPNQCADGTAGSVFASSLPSVVVVDPHYAPSKRISTDLNWRGSVLNNRFMATISGTYALNVNQPGEVDLNFNPMVQFTLPDEAGRPVYVKPSSIVASTGSIASRDARISQSFNRVSEVRSNLQSTARQLTIQLSPTSYSSHYQYSLAYTLSSNRRQLYGFSSTGGNPLDREWGVNDINAMHQLQLTLGFNFGNTLRTSWTIAARSGAPITPRISGDVNGDGVGGNDRAYVFEPNAIADSTFKASMQQLLDNGSPIARQCLRDNLGKIAPIGACHGPWTLSGNNSINLIVNPFKVRMPQRAQLRFQLGNPMGALDMLFHGSNNIRGWGQTATPDQTLFYVRGFDSTTHRFKYEVNQRFGSTRPQQTLNRSS